MIFLQLFDSLNPKLNILSQRSRNILNLILKQTKLFLEPLLIFPNHGQIDKKFCIWSLRNLIPNFLFFQNSLQFLKTLTTININFDSRVLYNPNSVLFHIYQSRRSQSLHSLTSTLTTTSSLNFILAIDVY